MREALYIFSGLMFLCSAGLHIAIRIILRKNYDDLEDCYHEFEADHPGLARYEYWRSVTFGAVIISMLILFIAAII